MNHEYFNYSVIIDEDFFEISSVVYKTGLIFWNSLHVAKTWIFLDYFFSIYVDLILRKDLTILLQICILQISTSNETSSF